MYNPIDISNFFIQKYGNEHNITPMKLVKLVYISHGWYLGFTGNPLLDENPEAWQYGPVIPSVYHYYKHHGSAIIRPNSGFSNPSSISNDVEILLNKVWNVYGKYSAIQLSDMTHQAGSPWYKTRHSIALSDIPLKGISSTFGTFSKQIPDNLIKEYYVNKISLNKATVGA